MAKKKRKKRAKKPYTGENRHHLLFQGRHWDSGKAKILREAFVYMLDVKVHDELHHEILHDVPKPSPEGILSIFNAFCEQRQEIMQFDIIRASEWLQNACNEEPFHTCMKHQTDFLKKRLK